jgi:hypothetical protein
MSGNNSNTTTTTLTSLLTTTTSLIVNITSGLTTPNSTATISTILTSTISSNQTDSCLQKNYSPATCRFAEFIRVLAYLFLSVSLVPQIIHLVNNGSRYIAGISYMWIIIRILGLASLMVAHAFKWQSIFEFIALISTIAMFIQIFIYADNLHRQQKVILIITSVSIWMIGGGIILLTRKHKEFLIMIGYLLLSVHMLPQVR